MKILVFPIILGLCIFVVFPAQAQLVVYDDFSGPFVDIARWYHRHSGTSDNVWPFEGGFRIQKESSIISVVPMVLNWQRRRLKITDVDFS